MWPLPGEDSNKNLQEKGLVVGGRGRWKQSVQRRGCEGVLCVCEYGVLVRLCGGGGDG